MAPRDLNAPLKRLAGRQPYSVLGRRKTMVDPTLIEKPIVISATDARGAGGSRSGTVGDTLLPMLIGVIVLTVIGVAIVVFVTVGHAP